MRISDWSSDVCSSDLIIAGNGNDMVSGDALAEGAEGAYAFAYSDDSIARPEDGFGDEDKGFANDTISGGEGNDSIGGDATAIAQGDGGEGFTYAGAEGVHYATFGPSERKSVVQGKSGCGRVDPGG